MRPMTQDDAEFVVAAFARAVDEGVLRDVPSHERIAAACDDEDLVARIIVVDGQPVGHVLLSGVTSGLGIIELRLVITTVRGSGYGRAALTWVREYVFSVLGAHRLWLEVVADNVVARRLYESLGFVQEGMWRDGFPDGKGNYHDLAVYSMLDHEYEARTASPERD